MEKNDLRSQIGEKNIFAKLSSLGNEEVDEMERLRKKINVMEVKIDDIYKHLLASRTIDPRKYLVDKLNLVSVSLLTVGILIFAVASIVLSPVDGTILLASIGIAVIGLVILYTSMYLQISRKEKDSSRRAE